MSNINDKVMTPRHVAKEIIDRMATKYQIGGTVLDPCRGQGAFFDQFPSDWKSDWCELDEGKDFFEYQMKVDWIISNPPYSIFAKWLDHSFTIANNIVYLIPVNKVVGSKTIIKKIADYGGIVEIYPKWSGRNIDFPFGFPCGSVYFKKDYDKDAILHMRF